MDIDTSPQLGGASTAFPGAAWSTDAATIGVIAPSPLSAAAAPAIYALRGQNGSSGSNHRPGMKRARTESPDRVAKRPALAQLHSLSTAPSPVGAPATPVALRPLDHHLAQQPRDDVLPATPPAAGVASPTMKRDGSTEFVQRTQRLGLRTPLAEEGGATPVGDQVSAPALVDLDMAMDVEMCGDVGTRPVLPIRRPSHRALSNPTSPRLSTFTSYALDPGVDPRSATLPGTRYYPLNRPHPVAFQQHLALSPALSGPFPTMSGFEAVVKSTEKIKTRSPSPIALSPPTSPQVSIMMDRRLTSGSASSNESSGHGQPTRMAHNGFPPSSSSASPGGGPRFAMGPRSDCEKCRMKVPGHYGHVIE